MNQNQERQESAGQDRFFVARIDGRQTMFVLHADKSVCIAPATQPVTLVEGPGTPGYVATQPEAEAPGFSFAPGVSEAERSSTDFQNLTAYSALNDALTQNHGEILALAKVRGRLEAMIESQNWYLTLQEGK
jgi:hypothetical protein